MKSIGIWLINYSSGDTSTSSLSPSSPANAQTSHMCIVVSEAVCLAVRESPGVDSTCGSRWYDAVPALLWSTVVVWSGGWRSQRWICPEWIVQEGLYSYSVWYVGLETLYHYVTWLWEKIFWLRFLLYLLVSWAWWDWPLTWLTSHCRSVL